MNLSQLRTFMTVVELGSFSEAARALGISQPAVTMQIRSLEDDLGTRLLDRRYRRIDTTEAGQLLLDHARTIFHEVDAARSSVEELKGTVSGDLRIAASTTPGDYVLPALFGSFLEKYPEVRLELVVADSSEVEEMVESAQAHVGVVGFKGSARVDHRELPGDEIVLIVPPNDPIASRRSIDLAQLADRRWVMREEGSGTRAVTEGALSAAGVDPDALDIAVELGSGEAVIGAVEGGLGIALISKLVARKSIELDTVGTVKLKSRIERPFHLVSPQRTLTRAASAFADHVIAATQ